MQASGEPIGSALSAKDVEVMDANSNDQDDRGTSAVAAVAADVNQPENAKEQSKGETQIEIEKLENPPPSTHDHLEEEAATKLGAGDEEEEGEEENAEDDEDEEKQDKEEEEINEEASDEENDYEAQRQRNIERNQAMLRQLGLLVDSSASAMASVFGASSPTSTTSSSLPSADATLAAGFSLQTPKRKYKPRQKRNVDTPTRTSSRLQTKSRRSYAENSFFKSLPPEEQAKILADEKKARKKARQERANADAEEGEETEEQRNLRNSNKWIGSRLYDSDRGITCHQCRQKTVDEKTTCANEFRIHTPARHHYCRRCLWNRYGEALDEVRKDATWLCPSCRGVCNCSFCRKKRGQAPTGVLDTAILQKYSSVAEYLQKDRQEKPAVSEEELRKMKETIEKEIKEGIRPSVPITTSAASQAEELNSELKDDLYYVEAIVEHRSTPRGLEYLIKWLGYGYDLNTWEPAAHLNCPHLIKEYHIRNKLPLLAKRGRKKRIVDDQAPSNAEEEKKRKEKHGVDEGEAAEKEEKGEKEDEAEEEVEEEEEEEEEAAEEEKIAEWQTRRPGRPKGRGIGRPRLVKGTGRGPRRSSSGDDEATTATATATTTSVVDEPEANRKAGKKRKAKEPPAATSKKSGKQGKNAKRTKKDDDDDEEEEEEMDTTKKTKKMKMRKGVKAKGDRTTAVKKRGKVNKGIETKDVRKSPRRKETQKPAEREANSSARKSPRLAKRTRGGQTEDGNEKAEAKVAKATGKRKRKETRSNDGKSVDKNEDLDQEEEERAKPLYWDEPVEKGKRRRSAPILLSDDFVILGNGEVRGEAREAKKKATAKKSTTTPKARSGKAANRRAKQEEKKGEEKGENGNETKENGTGTAKDKKETEQKNKTKKKQGKGIGKGKEEENGQDEAADNQVEDNGDDEERPLYWETAVPGKRRRTPNMAFFSDFLFHGGPLGSKKRKKATKDH